MLFWPAVLLMPFVLFGAASAMDYYVDANFGSDDPGSGTEANPFKTITYALGYATSSGDNIYIAGGTYDTALGESFPLGMNYNVSLLGAGPDVVTVDADQSAAHVISCISDGSPVISGLTITGGLAGAATAYSANAFGGGILIWNCWPTVQNCIITENEATGANAGAAGIACVGALYGTASPTIRDSIISHNSVTTTDTADGAGGGIGCLAVYWGTCDITIQDCAVVSNSVEAEDSSGSVAGGGIGCAVADDSNDTCTAQITNCLVLNNGLSAPVYAHGGGIYGHLSDLTMLNCTVADNSPDGVNVSGNTSTLTNSIIWNNGDDIVDMTCSDISHCDISDGTCDGTSGNISENPQFVSMGNGSEYDGYFLYFGGESDKSPCIDTGDTTDEPYGGAGNTEYSTDVDGYLDMTGGDDVDMGYHYVYGGLTFITLESFEASCRRGAVLLSWETGVEIDNAGFLIYRTQGSSPDYTLIGGLIPARGGPARGASYTLTDTDVAMRVSYSYYLIDVETNGRWTVHGPVRARCSGLPTADRPPRSVSGIRADRR